MKYPVNSVKGIIEDPTATNEELRKALQALTIIQDVETFDFWNLLHFIEIEGYEMKPFEANYRLKTSKQRLYSNYLRDVDEILETNAKENED